MTRYKNGDYKVVSGKTVKGWDKRTDVAVTALSELDKNAQYAGVAYVNLGGSNVPGGSDKSYAVALDSSYSEKINGTTYTMAFDPDENGHVAIPNGTTLEPMTLYALFETPSGTDATEGG